MISFLVNSSFEVFMRHFRFETSGKKLANAAFFDLSKIEPLLEEITKDVCAATDFIYFVRMTYLCRLDKPYTYQYH